MKKIITLFLFAAGFVTIASAQSGSYRNDSRSYDNGYQSNTYSNQYSRNSQWNDRRGVSRYERRRQLAARQRYEMMMRRNRARAYDRRYYRAPSYYSSGPSFQLSIGIGGRR